MKKFIAQRLRLSTIGYDAWRKSMSMLSKRDEYYLVFRKSFLILYKAILSIITFPYVLFRNIFRLSVLIANFNKLHFTEVSKIHKGEACVLDQQTWVGNGKNIFLGDFVKISAFTSLIAGLESKITIGSCVIIGPGVTIVSMNHGVQKEDVPIRFQPWEDAAENSIEIEEDVWVGANVTILPGTRIGKGSIIGASAVVRGDIPSNSVVISENKLIVKDRFSNK